MFMYIEIFVLLFRSYILSVLKVCYSPEVKMQGKKIVRNGQPAECVTVLKQNFHLFKKIFLKKLTIIIDHELFTGHVNNMWHIGTLH